MGGMEVSFYRAKFGHIYLNLLSQHARGFQYLEKVQIHHTKPQSLYRKVERAVIIKNYIQLIHAASCGQIRTGFLQEDYPASYLFRSSSEEEEDPLRIRKRWTKAYLLWTNLCRMHNEFLYSAVG
jgi:hypothetical protein